MGCITAIVLARLAYCSVRLPLFFAELCRVFLQHAQGIIFARISHPKNRARTVFISDCAVIARRDSVLKLMFRIADVRQTQVVSPTVSAILYTWIGRTTAEGEQIPVWGLGHCSPQTSCSL